MSGLPGVATVECGVVRNTGPHRPVRGSPPPAVEQAKAVARKRAEVAKVGVTTTSDGRWAVKVWLRNGARPPLDDVETAAGSDVPVVYQSEPDRLPIARPAYPALGE
jgi:hypothetical protein